MRVFGLLKKTNIGLVYWRQTLNQMYIVNAGNGFSIIWSTVKGFLDPKTSSKIHVLKNKDRSHLLEIIDPGWEFLLNNPILLACLEADRDCFSLTQWASWFSWWKLFVCKWRWMYEIQQRSLEWSWDNESKIPFLAQLLCVDTGISWIALYGTTLCSLCAWEMQRTK